MLKDQGWGDGSIDNIEEFDFDFWNLYKKIKVKILDMV